MSDRSMVEGVRNQQVDSPKVRRFSMDINSCCSGDPWMCISLKCGLKVSRSCGRVWILGMRYFKWRICDVLMCLGNVKKGGLRRASEGSFLPRQQGWGAMPHLSDQWPLSFEILSVSDSAHLHASLLISQPLPPKGHRDFRRSSQF